MSLSAADSNLVSNQQQLLSFAELTVVQQTMHALFDLGNLHAVPTAKDDRCAIVEAAVIRYVISSRR